MRVVYWLRFFKFAAHGLQSLLILSSHGEVDKEVDGRVGVGTQMGQAENEFESVVVTTRQAHISDEENQHPEDYTLSLIHI